ncbi:MAG: CCA tRNA nucleotidyltransferase [Nitrospinae bacterium]|nr:CCA tRNA nucleotidyltransferase [Nitrospinota bacterium]MBL7020441.1 CCA tRNA nucleotidyltransferase [Nitrospinaceae bacterium]
MDSSTQSILLELLNFSTCQNNKLFVVGGTLRDFLSQKPCSDFDLTGKNAAETGINFSRSLNFTCVPLDKTPGRKTVRVILDQKHHLDFTDLQGKTIEEDLSQRDFTINAMGQLLSDFLSGRKNIIDPHKGQEDLKNKKIRVLHGPIISSDPLRMLRAFRFAATLKFEIDTDTLTNISLHKARLIESAPERIWHELTLFFKATETLPLLKIMHGCGLLDCLFPVSNEAFVQYQKVASLLKDPAEIFPKYTDKFSVSAFLDKHYLVKLSVLRMMQNPDSETNPIENTVQRCNLRFSNAEEQLMQQSISGARFMTEMYLSPEFNEPYELMQKVHQELLASAILFVTYADGSNTEDRALFCNHLLKFYFEQYLPTVSEKPLLNGEDIIHQFNLSPSPLFGKILSSVQKSQVLGNITTREDAITLAGHIIQSQSNESNE